MLSKRGLDPNVNTVIKDAKMKNFDNLSKIISLIDGKKSHRDVKFFKYKYRR